MDSMTAHRSGICSFFAILAVATFALVPAGCDFLDSTGNGGGTTPPPKNGTSPPTTDGTVVTPPPPAERLIELNVSGRTRKLDTCYIKLLPSTSRTPAVLIVTSYPSPQEESFPSFYMRAALEDGDLQALLGKPIQAKIWLATEQNGPILRTPDDAPANITIRNADDDGRVVGSIINADLINTTNSDKLTITGRFDGSLN